MSPDEVAVAGVQVAKQAVHLLADGHEAEALGVLNSASHAETAWAAAFLLSALRESMADRFKKPAQLRWAMHKAANDPGDDVLTQVGVILQQADRDGP